VVCVVEWQSDVIVDRELITGQRSMYVAEFDKVLLANLNSQVRH